MKRFVVGIRYSDQPYSAVAGEEMPTVWFASIASLAAALSDDNRALLRLVRDAKPQSLTELANLTGRKI